MIWIIAAFGATALWAVVAIIDDNITKGLFKDPYAGTIASGLIALLVLVLLPFVGFTMPAWPIAVAALMAGACTILSYWFYFKVIMKEAASIAIALYNVSVLFTLVGAYLLFDESLHAVQYVGGVIILLAATGLTVKKEKKRLLAPSFIMMVLSSAFISAAFLLTKYVYLHVEFWSGFSLVAVGMALTSALFALIPRQGRAIYSMLVRSKLCVIGLFLCWEALNLCAVALYGYSISLGPLSVVQLIIATQPAVILAISFIGVLFVPSWFREATTTHLSRKIFFFCLMAVGVYIVSASYIADYLFSNTQSVIGL